MDKRADNARGRMLFLGSVIGTCLTSSVFLTLDRLQQPQMQHRSLTKEEIKDNFIITKTHEGSIVVTWTDMVPVICGPDVEACTKTTKNTCHVYLPAEMILEAVPSDQLSARWATPDDDETVAHEILHCFVNNWHETWDTKEYYRNLGK